MSAGPPYPGLPPNQKEVPIIGGRHRSCFVVELHSNEELDSVRKSQIREQLEAYLRRILATHGDIEKSVVAIDRQFDGELCKALKLPR